MAKSSLEEYREMRGLSGNSSSQSSGRSTNSLDEYRRSRGLPVSSPSVQTVRPQNNAADNYVRAMQQQVETSSKAYDEAKKKAGIGWAVQSFLEYPRKSIIDEFKQNRENARNLYTEKKNAEQRYNDDALYQAYSTALRKYGGNYERMEEGMQDEIENLRYKSSLKGILNTDVADRQAALDSRKSNKQKAKDLEAEFQTYKSLHQDLEDQKAVQAWAKGHGGNADSYVAAKADYEAADAEVQRLQQEIRSTYHTNWGGVSEDSNAQLTEAIRKRDRAQKILSYAQDHQYDETKKAEDFDLKADEGEQLFEQYKAGSFATEEGEQQYMDLLGPSAAEVGLTGEQARIYDEENRRTAMHEYRNYEANASQWDPTYNTEFMEPDDRWTEEERKTFFYLFATDRERANQYGAQINQRHNADDAADRDANTEEYATRNFGTGALSTVGSVAGNLLGGNFDYARMAAESAYRGDLYETQYEGLSRDADIVRSAISQELNKKGTLDESIPVLGGKGLGDLYQLGTSMMDSAAVAGTGGGVSNALFFGSAAAAGTRNALERGLSTDKAILLGAINGAAEVIGESISIENLLKQGGIEEMLRSGIFKNLLQQGAVEGSEEVLTTILNTLGDSLINGDKAELQQNMYANLMNGMSADEAQKAAIKQWVNDLGADALGGFLSGFGMSAGRTSIYAGGAAVTKYKGDTGALLRDSQLTDAGSKSRELADQYSLRYKEKGSISNLQAAKLQTNIADELTTKDRATLVEATTKRLESLNYENAASTAAMIVDNVMGTNRSEVRTKLEERSVDKSHIARIVQQELTEGLRGYGPAWSRQIQTKVTGLNSEREKLRVTGEKVKNVEVDGTKQKVKSAKMVNGSLQLSVENESGDLQTVDVDSLSDDQKAVLDRFTGLLGSDAAYAFNTMESWQDVDDYAVAFATIRDTFGRNNASLDYVKNSPLRARLTDAQVVQAYELGKKHGKLSNTREKSRRGAGVVTTDGGMINGQQMQAVSEESKKKGAKYIEAMGALAKALGVNIHFFESRTDADGNILSSEANGAYQDGEIWLDINAGMNNIREESRRAIFLTAAHELTHFIEQNSEQYAELRSFIVEYLQETKGQVFNDLVKEKMALEPGKSYDELVSEVVADSCQTMLQNSKYIQKMADEKPGLFNAIRTWLNHFLSRISARYEGAKYMQSVIDKLQQMWDAALQEAVESRVAEETLQDVPAVKEMQQAEPKVVESVFTTEMQRAIIDQAKNGNRLTAGQQKIADLYRQAQTVREAAVPNTQRMLPAPTSAPAQKLTPAQKAQITKRFNKAVNELIESYSFDGIDLSEEDARKMVMDYQAAHEGYFSMADEIKQKGLKVEKADGVAETVDKNGNVVAIADSDTGRAQFSIRTYDESGRDALRSFLDERIKAKALTATEANQIIDQIESLYDICKEYDNGKYAPFSAWSNAEVVSYDGRPVFSVVKPNGEYKLNLDFSLVCKKRRTLDAVFNEMISQGIMDDFDMVQESIAKINDIIRENGFETACGLCFVDSKRYRQGMIADKFVMMYNTQVRSLVKKGAGQKVDYFNYGGDLTKVNSGAGIDTLNDSDLDWTMVDKILRTEKDSTVKWKIANYLKNNPSARKCVMRGDFMSTAGFDAVKAQNPALLKLYNSKKGAGGPKAAQSDVQYLNEIIEQGMFNKKSAYEVGGVRIQSFSDYVGRLVFDYVQMVADLAAKELPAHSYTKEYMFAQQFGLTGIKINMSLVPEIIADGVAPGLDANGDYAWKDGQSFGSTVYDNNGKRMTAAEGFELAKQIQNADGYSRNCGTIAVGVSDEHIRKMLDDPEIRMIIPYHKSSLNHIVAAMMNIDKYKDYTLSQNTRERKNGKLVNIARSKEFNFNEALQRLGDAKAAANEYLSWCEENGYTPKFDQFAGNENYYKLLEDFSCYDRDGVTNTPMGAVEMVFPTDADAFGSMKDLIAEGLEEDAILQAKQEKAVPEIVEQIQSVLPEFEGTVRERNAKKKKKAQLSAREREAAAVEQSDVHTQYSVRQGPPPKKTMIGYKVFMADKKHPGQLYPTKVKNPGGQGTPVGVWLDADTGEIARNPDGSIKVNTKGRISVKANGGSLAWRPGWHLGSLPEANQMNREDKNNPDGPGLMWDNYIFCECEFAADEDYQLEAFEYGTNEYGVYTHNQAGLPYIPKDGFYKYRTNPDPSTSPWFISGSIRITKILDDDMRREIIEKWNAEHPDEQMPFTERYSGKPINLTEYGFTAGPVTPTADLSNVAPGVDYSDEIKNLPGYTRRALNFDDPNVQQAFRIQQIEDRKDYYIDRYNREHAADLEGTVREKPVKKKTAQKSGKVQFAVRQGMTEQKAIVADREKIAKLKPKAQKSARGGDDGQALINETMTMQQAKRMLEMTFNANNIRQYSDGKYRTAEQWLRDTGVDEVAMYAENTENVIFQYINRIPALVEYEVSLEDVFTAYLNGTLTGKAAQKTMALDVSKGNGYSDKRFYAPASVSITQDIIDMANQRVTEKNRADVYNARKQILFAVHSEQGFGVIGLSATELNKRLRSWSRYPAAARDLSMKLNDGVAAENSWTGLQNSSILSRISVTDDDIRSLVNDITGESSQYQRDYIGRTMLALDTHIDWSELVFDFRNTGLADPNSNALGFYDDSKRLIAIGSRGNVNTVAHEMGHALDHKWSRDLFGKTSMPLSENIFDISRIEDPDGQTFYRHFQQFIQSLEASSDITSSYEQRGTEIFARFVAKFVEWTENTAGGSNRYESTHYKDRFTYQQYNEFVKLLQEKAMLDSKRLSAQESTQLSAREREAAAVEQSDVHTQYSVRDNSKTDRDLLMEADESKMTEAQQKALQNYKAKANNYIQREQKVSDALRVMDQMVRTGADREKIAAQRSKVSNLEAGMAKALRELTAAEDGNVIREILRNEREIQRRRTRMQVTETLTRRELRKRIETLHKRLTNELIKPSQNKNIQPGLMKQAAQILEAVNMDTTRPNSVRGESVRARLLEFSKAYERIHKDSDYPNTFDPVVAELIDKMVDAVGDTPINRMNASQLRAVYEALTAFDKTAREAFKMRIAGEERDAFEMAKNMIAETGSVPGDKKNLLNTWLNAQFSPERMFNRLGGYHKNSAWSQVYRMLNDGQLKQTQIQMEGSMIFEDLLASKEYERNVDPKRTVDIGLKDSDGNAVLLTHGLMLSLYMHLQSEDNTWHVVDGGFKVPNLKDYYTGKNNHGANSAVRVVGVSVELSEANRELRHAQQELKQARANGEDIEELKNAVIEAENRIEEIRQKGLEFAAQLRQSIEEHMTEYDRQWIAAAKELFDVYSKEQINSTTMDVYGIKRATVDNYFPIWVDGNFLDTPFESIAKDMSLENVGYLKERVNSGKPIILADIGAVSSTQLRRVSQYCGLMPVVRNFNKIWGKVLPGYATSLKEQVSDKFGESGIKYIENVMADLNGARGGSSGPLGDMLNRMRGHMAQASLTLSLRVALGQTASYPTAASVLGWDALRKGLGGGKVDTELIRKYSPLMWYRMKGYSTSELGDIASMNSKWDRVWKKARWATGWIQAMDGLTVGRLWKASEFYVQDHNKALVKGTDAYYQEVAKVFNDVVEKTQPDYTTMQRPDILRNPNALVKQLTMFLTQRLQNFNIIYDAAATYSQMRKDSKAGYGETSPEDVRQAGVAVRRAVISQVVAAATISAFKFAADAILHSMNNYRDDDDEITKESFSLEMLDMFLDSLAGNMLGGGEIYDLIESKAFGKTYYGIEVAGVSVVTDVVGSANKFFDMAFQKDADPKKVRKAADRLAINLGSLVGIPWANGKKIIMAAYYHGQDMINGEFLSMEAGVDRTIAQESHRLYRAYRDMNYGQANKIREEVGDDDKLNTALTGYIKQQYKDGAITQQEAVQQLIKYVGKDKDAATKTIRQYAAEVETGIKFDNISDEFQAGNVTAAEAEKMLVKYGGMEAATAKIKVAYWDFQNKNAGSGMEWSTFQVYYNKYKPVGLSPEMYEVYYDGLKQCKGTDLDGDGKTDSGSKKAEVLALIDSMRLTSEQKDELYRLQNYGERTLKDAPWHK